MGAMAQRDRLKAFLNSILRFRMVNVGQATDPKHPSALAQIFRHVVRDWNLWDAIAGFLYQDYSISPLNLVLGLKGEVCVRD